MTKATSAQALQDLSSLAHWVEGQGDCGVLSVRWLADRWNWSRYQVRGFLTLAQAEGIIRRSFSAKGTHVIILKEHENLSGGKIPYRTFTAEARIMRRIVSRVFDVPAGAIERCAEANPSRGRPSRPKRHQLAFHAWLYLMNVSAGYGAQQISSKTGLHRRTAQNAASVIEEARGNDSGLELLLEMSETAYFAAIAALASEDGYEKQNTPA